MNAQSLLMILIKESVNLEKVGSFTLPEEGYRDFLCNMFGKGIHEACGLVKPNTRYLYTYGEELDAVYDVLLRNDAKECIALVKVGS